MRQFFFSAAITCLFAVVGCHSPYVSATVSNQTAQRIELIEVDYPSAGFGTQDLAPGSDYQYRFKVLGTGNMKLLYTDSAHQSHTSNGPFLEEGAEGSLGITITPTGVLWHPGPGVVARK